MNIFLILRIVLAPFVVWGVVLLFKSVYKKGKNKEIETKGKGNWRIFRASVFLFFSVLFLLVVPPVVRAIIAPPPTIPIEYHAADEIYHRPDVQKVIKKYPEEQTRVVPLNYTLIEDTEFINRILPEYRDVNIHCIIWAQTPEWNKFFLEDADSAHTYIELSESELLSSLNRASIQDQNLFWMNFKPKIDLGEYHGGHTHAH